MITYLFNFILCSGLLLLVYRLFLANEKLYRFNRFYLLFSLIFSLAVPLITINIPSVKIPYFNEGIVKQTITQPIAHQDVLIGTNEPMPEQISAPTVTGNPIIQASVHNYLPGILLSIYGIATLIMLIRFAKNSWHISKLIAKNTAANYHDTQLILVNEDVTPHSFLKYVFINKDEYNNGHIEPQIICHEQAHVRQLHSLDVIFVELLQIVCWFNPFISFYRKAIQLNHEFLADEAVIENYQDTPAYQYLLLEKASQTGGLYLTSQFNYLTTKKRLLMMTKRTSATVALYKKLALVPLLAVAILIFCNKVIAKNEPGANTIKVSKRKSIKSSNNDADSIMAINNLVKISMYKQMRVKHAMNDAPAQVIEDYQSIIKKYDIRFITAGGKKIADISAADTAQMHKLFAQMSKQQQDRQYVRFVKAFKPMPKNSISQEQLQLYQDSKTYGVWIDGKRIKNTTLASYKPEDFDHIFFSRLTPIAIENDGFNYQIDLMTKTYYADYYKKTMGNQADKLIQLRTGINRKMTSGVTDKRFPPPIVQLEQ